MVELFLRFTGLAQADYSNGFFSLDIRYNNKPCSEKTNRVDPFLSVIEAIINSFESIIPLKIDDIRKINAMLFNIPASFLFVPFILRCFIVSCLYPNAK
jgi:hypothetical protein